MKYLIVFVSLFVFVSLSRAQEPVEKVPRLIAKVPERSDFFGEWLRQDGTYRLVISQGKDGQVEAKYFNPKPINVESAEFGKVEGMTVLTVVLRDEGYPGSTYRLAFDSSYRVLMGVYFMPATGQRHEVYFNEVTK